MKHSPLPRAKRRAVHSSRPLVSKQVRMLLVTSRRLSPEKAAHLFRLARELEALGY